MGKFMIIFLALVLLNSLKLAAQLNLKRPVDTAELKIRPKLLPLNFYNQPIGWFCKKEIQIQKLTSLPIFIRLGSKEYVDYLEHKPNTAFTPLKH